MGREQSLSSLYGICDGQVLGISAISCLFADTRPDNRLCRNRGRKWFFLWSEEEESGCCSGQILCSPLVSKVWSVLMKEAP